MITLIGDVILLLDSWFKGILMLFIYTVLLSVLLGVDCFNEDWVETNFILFAEDYVALFELFSASNYYYFFSILSFLFLFY